MHAIIAGASHIDHVDVLRSGSTEAVLGHRLMAPSTIGTFLRLFTFGDVRQLEAVIGRALERAWALLAGPGESLLVIDIDSTICEVAGKNRHGAGYGYTKVLGYRPIIATRAATGEVLHARRFLDELVPRVRRAGANGELTMRFDAGFWSNETIKMLSRHVVSYTMAVRAGHRSIATAIATSAETAWRTIDYTPGGRTKRVRLGSSAQTAAELGVSPAAIHLAMRRHGVETDGAWVRRDTCRLRRPPKRELERLWTRHESIKAVAHELGVAHTTTAVWLADVGIFVMSTPAISKRETSCRRSRQD